MLLFSHTVVSDSAIPWTAACQASLSFTSQSSNSCPLSPWCHPTISSSVVPFSSWLQSFLTSGSFPVSQLFKSGSQRIGASVSVSVLPVNIQGWFPLGLTGSIFLQSKGLSRVFSNNVFESVSSWALSLLFGPTLTFIHDYWKSHSFDCIDFRRQWYLCFLICCLGLSCCICVIVTYICVCIYLYMNVKVAFHTLVRKFIGKKYELVWLKIMRQHTGYILHLWKSVKPGGHLI